MQRRYVWFLVPCIMCMIIVAGIPTISTVCMGMTDAHFGSDKTHFVWFENYKRLIHDPHWIMALKNTLLIVFSVVPCEMFLGMIIALALYSQHTWGMILRISILIPWAMPTIISAKIWAWMLHDVYGVLNHIMCKMSLIKEPIMWLASEKLTIAAIMLVEIWRSTPYISMLFLAGLHAIPKEYAEAASVDGFSKAQIFRHITLPLMHKTIIFTAILRALDAIRIFDIAYIMGNGHASTDTLSIYTRKHLVDYSEIGYGSASASILLLIFLIFCAVYIYTRKSTKYAYVTDDT